MVKILLFVSTAQIMSPSIGVENDRDPAQRSRESIWVGVSSVCFGSSGAERAATTAAGRRVPSPTRTTRRRPGHWFDRAHAVRPAVHCRLLSFDISDPSDSRLPKSTGVELFCASAAHRLVVLFNPCGTCRHGSQEGVVSWCRQNG